MAEVFFVKTFKRDYVALFGPFDAQSVLKQIPILFNDYNENAPHKSLKMMALRQFISKAIGG